MRVKICGITRPADAVAAAEAGATYVGLVFFPPSPRSLDADAARAVSEAVPEGVTRVGLVVDPDDALIDRVAPLVDMLQLHGSETPERAAEIRARAHRAVMKALGVRAAGDLDWAEAYVGSVEQLLLDAKPPEGATRPGGNAVAFDWRLLAGRRITLPWLLAGGLTPENVAEAAYLTGATQVDVSSGVESAPGVKDPALVRAFIAAAGEAG